MPLQAKPPSPPLAFYTQTAACLLPRALFLSRPEITEVSNISNEKMTAGGENKRDFTAKTPRELVPLGETRRANRNKSVSHTISTYPRYRALYFPRQLTFLTHECCKSNHSLNPKTSGVPQGSSPGPMHF